MVSLRPGSVFGPVFGLACGLVGVLLGMKSAQAQSPIEFIFNQNASRGFYQAEQIYPPIRRNMTAYRHELPVITVYPPSRDGQPGYGPERRRYAPPAMRYEPSLTENTGGPRAFCVRACDGFFFPAPAGLAATRQESYCRSACPGAETRLFSLRSHGTIVSASDQRGTTYSALKTAFQFRSKVSSACSCSGSLTNGLARLPITEDITLRAGDAVMMQNGVRIFAGASRFPYAPTDFVEVRRYRRLPSFLTQHIASLQAAESYERGGSGQGQAIAQRRGARITTKTTTPTQTAEPSQMRIIDINHKMEKQQL